MLIYKFGHLKGTFLYRIPPSGPHHCYLPHELSLRLSCLLFPCSCSIWQNGLFSRTRGISFCMTGISSFLQRVETCRHHKNITYDNACICIFVCVARVKPCLFYVSLVHLQLMLMARVSRTPPVYYSGIICGI